MSKTKSPAARKTERPHRTNRKTCSARRSRDAGPVDANSESAAAKPIRRPLRRQLRRPLRRHRRGLSLLEVILAIAILGGALVSIGHLVRLGSRSAVKSQQLNSAQVISQSIMAEITAGSMPPDAIGLTQYPFDPNWLFMVELVPVETLPGLMAVRVSVQENLPAQKQPVAYTLVRWIPDPSLNLEDQNEAFKEAAALAEEAASE